MYIVENCLACGSSNILARPGFLTRMIVWRSTGNDPSDDIPNHAMICLDCTFEFSELRLTEDEEKMYYQGYRNNLYNEQRKICTPFYENLKELFVQPWYIENRKKAVESLVSKFIDPNTVTKVLDYGGDDGSLIPDCFINSRKYVYDLSGRALIDGVKKLDYNDQSKFDVIICSHVLEHKSIPEDLIEELKHFMDASSYLYIEVPFKEVGMLPPNTFDEHLNHWNQKSITKLLSKLDINILKMSLYNIIPNSTNDLALKIICKLDGVV